MSNPQPTWLSKRRTNGVGHEAKEAVEFSFSFFHILGTPSIQRSMSERVRFEDEMTRRSHSERSCWGRSNDLMKLDDTTFCDLTKMLGTG